ncbi:MAG: LOG family protein [Candidatus Peribacteraceae bacterium]
MKHNFLDSDNRKKMEPETLSLLTMHRSVAYEGVHPTSADIDELAETAEITDDAMSVQVLEYCDEIRTKIQSEQVRWQSFAQDPKGLKNMQDIFVAQQLLPEHFGGAITTFGSARTREGDPRYEAVRWLNKTLVQELMQDDGTMECAHSGAGPGIMEAANKGAMEGRIERIRQLKEQAQLGDGIAKIQLDTVARSTHSMGIRIDLPFEQTFNPFLQLNLTLQSFFARKLALLAPTIGRTTQDNGDDTHMKRHKRHPAIFVAPGGFGTLDEMWEAATLLQCRKMKSLPIIVLGAEMRAVIKELLSMMLKLETISPKDVDFFVMKDECSEIDALYAYLEYYGIPETEGIRSAVSRHKRLL